jgi:hypothetical protein
VSLQTSVPEKGYRPELLSEAKQLGDLMSQTVGEGGKASQIKGDQNTVSIT